MNDKNLYRYLPSDNKIELDPEGYLVEQDVWSPKIAELLAEDEGVTLTDEHWELIHLVRDFYARYEMAPAMRPLVKATKQALGDEKGRSVYLMALFPGSPPKRLARIAGLPKPTNCL